MARMEEKTQEWRVFFFVFTTSSQPSPLSFTHRPLPSLSLSQSFTLCTGSYLEIFGRKNNLRDFWVTVGNEVTGKGPPREDVEALAGGAARVPGAVYGAAR